MTYDQLALIADAYIPILFFMAVSLICKDVQTLGLNQVVGQISAILLSIVIVYAVMFFDIKFKIWPAFQSDYSTHTALALVFICYFLLKSKIQMYLSITSLIIYSFLMIYQQYHTAMDIISTALVLIPVFLLLQKYSKKINLSN